MNELIKAVTELLKVKSLITLIIITVFAIMALRGLLDSKDVMMVVGLVCGSYFSYQAGKAVGTRDTKN